MKKLMMLSVLCLCGFVVGCSGDSGSGDSGDSSGGETAAPAGGEGGGSDATE